MWKVFSTNSIQLRPHARIILLICLFLLCLSFGWHHWWIWSNKRIIDRFWTERTHPSFLCNLVLYLLCGLYYPCKCMPKSNCQFGQWFECLQQHSMLPLVILWLLSISQYFIKFIRTITTSWINNGLYNRFVPEQQRISTNITKAYKSSHHLLD